jgi:exonuclease III
MPNIGAPNFTKQILLNLKIQIDINTVVVGDFNTPLSPLDRSSRQKIKKETLELYNTIDQMDLVNVYRVFHPTMAQYTFFSAAHGVFFRIGHILCQKASHNIFKKIEITP